VKQFALCECGFETDARCRARQVQEVRSLYLCPVDYQGKAELLKNGLDLADAKIFDKATFELIERGARKVGSRSQLRLREATGEPRAPDFMPNSL